MQTHKDIMMSKSTLLKGTFILTLAGFLTRILGFFYKIYLSNMLGAEKLGIYQLVFPIYGICFTLYASGIQTAISKLVASENGRQGNHMKKILGLGILLSFSISLTCSFVIYHYAEWIAANVIYETECTQSLKILAYVFPFCGLTSCINGYYYGLKRTGVPAMTQFLEQCIRICSVYFLALFLGRDNFKMTCELAIWGIVFGEIASALYNVLSMLLLNTPIKKRFQAPKKEASSTDHILKVLLALSIPLTANRFLISILHSFEAILIPNMLKLSGLSNSEALSIYGILTGMSIAFIQFPSTVTNSLAVLLLPSVSEAQSLNNNFYIKHTTHLSIKYSLLVGILSTGIFIIFGNAFGTLFFKNTLAGDFLVTLSWLCPFIYLATTLSSIINGLGKSHLTFFNTIIGLSVRILFIVYMVPKQGISGYLIGLLVSQLTISLLDYLVVKKAVSIHFEAIDWLIKPTLILIVVGFIIKPLYHLLTASLSCSPLLILTLCCCFFTFLYIILLVQLNIITKKDLKNN